MRNIVCEEKIHSGHPTRLVIAFPSSVTPPQAQEYLDQHFAGFVVVSIPESPAPLVVCDERAASGGASPGIPEGGGEAIDTGASNPFSAGEGLGEDEKEDEGVF